ncbi:putative transmembrane protein [Escherichia phage 107]|nr:putative transmembrane protein [Escherichia phage 107]
MHLAVKVLCLTNLANSQLLTKALKQEPLMIEGINQCGMS